MNETVRRRVQRAGGILIRSGCAGDRDRGAGWRAHRYERRGSAGSARCALARIVRHGIRPILRNAGSGNAPHPHRPSNPTAFTAGVMNIGAEGQLLAGATAAVAVGLALGHSASRWVTVPMELLSGGFAGAAWALSPHGCVDGLACSKSSPQS